MKTLDEQWNGVSYYIKAEMTVDPEDVNRRIAEALNDKQKTQELEASRRRIKDAEAKIEQLKKELANNKDNTVLMASYQKQTDALAAEEYFTKGYNARKNGFNELAIEYYQKAIDLNPNYAMAYNNMGNAYYGQENYKEAIRCYQKAIDLNPNYATAYNNMGNAYDDLKNYKEAIRCYQKAIDLNPNYASAYYNMGIAYKNLENYKEAIRCYQKAIELYPNHASAYNNMGSSYYDLGNEREQINCYKKAAQLGDEDVQEWLRKNGYSW
jgi:tetratricopeptide (TPR) repeat protein